MRTRNAALGAGLGLSVGLALMAARRARRRNSSEDAGSAGNAASAWRRTVRDRVTAALKTASDRVRFRATRDARLVERVRSAIGRAVRHSGSIELSAYHGLVTLSGSVIRREINPALEAACAVKGVMGVENALEILEMDEPLLKPPMRFQKRWSVGKRLAIGSAASAMTGAALRRFGLLGLPAAVAGAAVAARAITNLPARRLFGRAPRTVEVFCAVLMKASPETLFDFWSRFDDLPRHFGHLREVRRTGSDNEWRLTLGSTSGVAVSWNAWMTERIPGKLVAWESAPGSAVRMAGVVEFTDAGAGATRVALRLSYHPRTKFAGKAIASAFGVAPQKQIAADLVRMKTYLETSNAARDAASA